MDGLSADTLRQKVLQKLAEIEAADTPENERRLTEMIAARGMQLRRGRRKGAARYTVKHADGSQIVGVCRFPLNSENPTSTISVR
ncbi:MAG: hypothetical protein ABS76_29100 [Pelagibacterium sp. SCN 64-44]|nr:MAG: hypothetical protein ABS76_29100 [Pelagibacterium sp. SCN 64-44]